MEKMYFGFPGGGMSLNILREAERMAHMQVKIKHNYLIRKGDTEISILAKTSVDAINKVSKQLDIKSIHDISMIQMGYPNQVIL